MAETASNGTRLTRHGQRVEGISSKPATAAITVNATPAATPIPTIRTMVVCVPGELSRELLTAHQLGRHLGVQGTLAHRFWAIPALKLWQRSQMLGLRKAKTGPQYCAGGPIRLLDVAGMRHAAGLGAGIRHQLWSQVVHGTRPATPWPAYEARYLADPQKYPYEAAFADFTNQPRINAMRMHNAVQYGASQLAVEDLEMFQAGCMAYQHYCAFMAVVGDAVMTAEGARLAPASDAMAHRVTYLEQANRYLGTVDVDQRLLAVAL